VEALEAPPVTSLDSADNSALIIKTQTYTTKIMNTSTQCLQPARDYGNLIYPLNNFLFTRCLYIHFFYEKHSSWAEMSRFSLRWCNDRVRLSQIFWMAYSNINTFFLLFPGKNNIAFYLFVSIILDYYHFSDDPRCLHISRSIIKDP
jgi:hypothetical protein